MRILKNTWTYTFSVLFLIIFSFQVLAADFVLKDVLDADERIANQRPTLLISPLTGEFIKIKKKWYELRVFIFETKKSKYEPAGTLTFAKLIEKFNLLYLGATPSSESLFPNYYFYATRDVKAAGVSFAISLRQVSDTDIVIRLENLKKNKANTQKSQAKKL